MTPPPRQVLKIIGITLAGVFAIFVAIVISLLVYTTTPHFSSTAGEWLSEKSGRKIVLGEDAQVRLWQREPRVILKNVVIDNASWSKHEAMFEAKRIEFTIRPWGLLRGRLVLPELILDEPKLRLEKNSKGEANWHATENPGGAAMTQPMPDKRADIPLISRLIINGGSLQYTDAREKIDTTLEISTVRGEAEKNETITVKGKGTFQNAPFILDLKGASILQLRTNDEPYPFSLHTAIGDTKIDAEGTVQDPVKMEKLDVTLKLKGSSAADLFPITGIVLPRTPPYSVTGRLIRTSEEWTFNEFSGRMGNSDLKGNVSWYPEQKPPYFKGHFVSENLDMNDLAPFIGADRRPADETRIIPDMPLDISRLMAMNADMTFEGKHVKTPNILEDFLIKAELKDGTLKLKPVSFGIAKGTVENYVTIEGTKTPPLVTIETRFKRLQLDDLFAPLAKRFGKDNVSAGLLGGVAKLQGTGQSLHTVLARANGTANFGMEGGSLSKLLLELAGLDIFRSAGLIVRGNDKPVPVHCVLGEFGVTDGIMQTREFLIDTEVTTLRGEGTVSLRDEAMDLEIRSYPKKPTLISLRTPIRIKGTFRKPRIGLDPAALILRGGAATALALLTPPAALIAFIGPSLSETGGCAEFVNRMSPPAKQP